MISLNELLHGHSLDTVPKEHADNLSELLEKINKVRVAWAKPMTVTSGYRSKEDHIRIYHSLGKSDEQIPWGSQHLTGSAVDISDPDGSLMKWCKTNEAFLVEVGLWIEDDTTQARVHFQIRTPKSGSRFFKP